MRESHNFNRVTPLAQCERYADTDNGIITFVRYHYTAREDIVFIKHIHLSMHVVTFSMIQPPRVPYYKVAYRYIGSVYLTRAA